MKTVCCYAWTEYEDAVQRDDGYTVHLNVEEAEKYMKKYFQEQKSYNTPGCYWRPSGSLFDVEISDSDYKRLVKVGSVRVSNVKALKIVKTIEIEW